MVLRLFRRADPVRAMLQRHFGSVGVESLITAGRTFPVTARVALIGPIQYDEIDMGEAPGGA